jgi:hypothetical protein
MALRLIGWRFSTESRNVRFKIAVGTFCCNCAAT